MEPNNFEKNIQEQFNKRTVEPSAQAWDRLDAMLTVSEEKKPKKGFFWMGMAASFIVFLGIGFLLIQNEQGLNTKQEIVLESNEKEIENKATTNTIGFKNEAQPETYASNNKNKIEKNNTIISSESISDKPQLIKNLTNYLTDEQLSNITPTTKENTTTKRKYNYISPDALLAEVEAGKKTSAKKNNFKSSLTVDANELLLSAEADMNPSFKEKAFAKFKEVQTVYNNRNLE